MIILDYNCSTLHCYVWVWPSCVTMYHTFQVLSWPYAVLHAYLTFNIAINSCLYIPIFWSHSPHPSYMFCLLFVIFRRAFLISHIFYYNDTSQHNNIYVYIHSCHHMLSCILFLTFPTYTLCMASMRNDVSKVYTDFLTSHSIIYCFYLQICHQYTFQHLQVWVPLTTLTMHFSPEI